MDANSIKLWDEMPEQSKEKARKSMDELLLENGEFQKVHITKLENEYMVTIKSLKTDEIMKVIMCPKEVKPGRPKQGETKKVSVTLDEHTWKIIDSLNISRSSFFREVTEQYLSSEYEECSQFPCDLKA